MSAATQKTRSKRRALLLLMMLLFFSPLLLSFLIYYGTSWRPTRSTNHGRLIQPPRTLTVPPLPRLGAATLADAAVLMGKWSLVYVGAGRCDEDCRRTLYFIRQTDLGLGNLSARVQQVFLVSADCCDEAFLAHEHPNLITLNAQSDAAASLLAQFPLVERRGGIFIVDPRANLMMRYDSSADPKGLRDDLKKLLSLSHIG